jgi:hypothetical protein
VGRTKTDICGVRNLVSMTTSANWLWSWEPPVFINLDDDEK